MCREIGNRSVEQPLIPVWDAGRLFNRLRFHADQVWLLMDDEQRTIAEALWDEFSLAGRDIFPSVQDQDQFRDVVQASREACWRGFGSTHHYALIDATKRQLFDRIRLDENATIEELRHEGIAGVTRGFRQTLQSLQLEIEHQLAEVQCRVLRLAMHMDSGVRPMSPSPEMFEEDTFTYEAGELLGVGSTQRDVRETVLRHIYPSTACSASSAVPPRI